MVIASGTPIDLRGLLRAALELLPEPHRNATDSVDRLLAFLQDRLFQMTLEDGAPHDLIRAALAAGWEDVVDFRRRVEALHRLSREACWPALVSAVERTYNISKAAPPDAEPDPALYQEEPEQALGRLYAEQREAIAARYAEGDYVGGSMRFAEVFAGPLHAFFDQVFVNVDDARLRANRLALLRAIYRLYASRVADLSRIVTGVTDT
jgi:glycyl-tRNA synthetase beta chain